LVLFCLVAAAVYLFSPSTTIPAPDPAHVAVYKEIQFGMSDREVEALVRKSAGAPPTRVEVTRFESLGKYVPVCEFDDFNVVVIFAAGQVAGKNIAPPLYRPPTFTERVEAVLQELLQ